MDLLFLFFLIRNNLFLRVLFFLHFQLKMTHSTAMISSLALFLIFFFPLCWIAGFLVWEQNGEVATTFDLYAQQYRRNYSFQEYPHRKEIFERRVRQINEFNQNGNRSYVRGVNEFTDWTDEEIQVLSGARPYTRRGRAHHFQTSYQATSLAPPFQVDYRTWVPAILTAVKNQGHCGSCWAHSAAEAMESHWALLTGRLHVLSQQELTSCTPNPKHCGGSGGCSGAVESLAFEYVQEAGGISEEWAYPYTSYDGDTGLCRNNTVRKVVKVSSYVKLPPNNQEVLMDALASRGPIAVSVDASDWSSYRGGIYDGCNYEKNITQNHAVQLVGYGHDYESNKDYWIIRNSWGPQWGEGGYMRLLRDAKPKCGWAVDTHSGGACDGEPDVEWVCGMCGILYDATFPVMDIS